MSELLVEETTGVMRLSINRADALNALNNAFLHQFISALEHAETTSTVRAVLLTAEGERGFSSGIDLRERSALTVEGKADQSRLVLRAVEAFHQLSKPTFAAVAGWCLGAGLEIALASDVRIAADDASFGFPEMTLGAYPGGGGAVLLPRLIGRQGALEWLYSARRLTALEARELGLVVSVVPRAELLQKAREQAGAAAACAPLAVAALKRSINASVEMPLSKAFEWDQLQRRPLDATQDYEEGLKAFREKRPPVFRGV